MQEADSEAELRYGGWSLAIVGRVVDDRGRAAVDFVGRQSGEVIAAEYDANDFELEMGGRRLNAEEVEEYLEPHKGRSVVLEASTLGFVEIFLICRALRKLGGQVVTLIYVEPRRYANPRRSHLLERRDFELSEEVPGYKAIPGATLMMTDRRPVRAVFFLGYEGERLARALEDYQMIRPGDCCVVFGVPAFRPGWEMDAFANNIRVIDEWRISGGVHFCGAENPAGAVDVLVEVYKGLREKERLIVAPIGTKPNGIGAALFAAAHWDVGILYDHPRRRTGRSSETGRWHLFRVDFAATA